LIRSGEGESSRMRGILASPISCRPAALGRTTTGLGQCISLERLSLSVLALALLAARGRVPSAPPPDNPNGRNGRKTSPSAALANDAQERLVFSLFTMSKPSGEDPQ
jgi:hypothetical protein